MRSRVLAVTLISFMILISGCQIENNNATTQKSITSSNQPKVLPPRSIAVRKIASYASGESLNTPTIQDYIDAQIDGVNEENINYINDAILGLNYNDINTHSLLQNVINKYLNEYKTINGIQTKDKEETSQANNTPKDAKDTTQPNSENDFGYKDNNTKNSNSGSNSNTTPKTQTDLDTNNKKDTSSKDKETISSTSDNNQTTTQDNSHKTSTNDNSVKNDNPILQDNNTSNSNEDNSTKPEKENTTDEPNTSADTRVNGDSNTSNSNEQNTTNETGTSSDSNNSDDNTTTNDLENAIKSGKASLTTKEDLLDATIKELSKLKDGDSMLKKVYQNNSIDYTPEKSSQIFKLYGDPHQIFPLLYGNKNNILATAGYKYDTRFIAFGSIPMYFFQNNKNMEYQDIMRNEIEWLIDGDNFGDETANSSHKIALSFTNSNTIKDWLENNFPNWEFVECNSISEHKECIKDSSLIVQGSKVSNDNAKEIVNNIKNAMKDGTPLLYLHPNWGTNDTSDAIGKLLGYNFPYGGNWWSQDSAVWSDESSMQEAVYSRYADIEIMIKHFKNSDYSFDWSKCEKEDCSMVPNLNSDFQNGASKVKKMLDSLDIQKLDIFNMEGYRLQKLLALIGDKFRQDVEYPMDKESTDDNIFLQSLYADHAVYIYRKINPTQPDMGNFSRSDFSHITPITKQIQMTTRKYFRATGAYALPGKSIKVTRNDNSDVKVTVFINTLRSGATHQYATNGYKRPKYLQSQHISIKPGETITLTSPYGGPIEFGFDKNDQSIDITLENVGEHPFWKSSADDDSFTQKLDAGDYDWAEISTEAFEVHSKLDKMRQSVNSWQTPAKLAEATSKYVSNYPHILAGFQGKGIDVVAEIHDFANQHDLTIENIDIVKHMNADQATCGYGCSGNPYDAYWAFSPIGHGDLHELGHGLESSRMRFEGWEGHSTTNPYSYYSKSKYFINTNNDPQCQKLPFKYIFDKLQQSVKENNSTKYLKDNLWAESNWSHQVLVLLQAMMHAQKLGKLKDGWDLLPRLHILDREIKRAKNDWDNKKSSIGFSNYTLDEFNNISNNDWLVISYSFATGLDYRDYLDMLGIEYSQKASQQVESFGYEKVPKKFFVSTPDGYCKSDDYGTQLDREWLDIDGESEYPY